MQRCQPVRFYHISYDKQSPNTIILFCLSKYDFPQCLSSALSLVVLSFLFLTKVRVGFEFGILHTRICRSLRGDNPTNCKIMTCSYISLQSPGLISCQYCVSLYCTVLARDWRFIMIVRIVYILYLFGSSPHRTHESEVVRAHILNFVLGKTRVWTFKKRCARWDVSRVSVWRVDCTFHLR